MTMKRKLLTGPRLIGALVLLVLAAALFVALRKPAVEVDTAHVARGAMTVTIDDLGETRVTDLYVVSAPVTGVLERVPLKPGAAVVPGATLLARIRPLEPAPLDARSHAQTLAGIRSLEAQLAASRARIGDADAALLLAERELDRAETLGARGFVAQAGVDRARAARDRSRAAAAEARQAAAATLHSLEAARATLLGPGARLRPGSAVPVTAPVPGYVLRVPQESERVVVAGTPLVEVGDPARLEMVTDLLSADAVRVQPGAAVLIDAWGGERPLRGRVRLIEPFGFTKISALGVEEQRVNVVIDFVDPRQAWVRLGHGYRATVRIAIWSAPDVAQVPIGALFRTGNRWAVFAVDAGGRARLTPVELGRMNDEAAELRSGLRAGARVILHPGEKVAEGVRVRNRS